jgi:hypothetical protein
MSNDRENPLPPPHFGLMAAPTSQLSNFSEFSDFSEGGLSQQSTFSTTDSLMMAGGMYEPSPEPPTTSQIPYTQPSTRFEVENLSLPAGYNLQSEMVSDQDGYDQMNDQAYKFSLAGPLSSSGMTYFFLNLQLFRRFQNLL